MLRCVIDTNVLLVCVSDKSPMHWLYNSFRTGAYELCVTTEILAEYAEVLERHMGPVVSQDIVDSIVIRRNLVEVEPAYRFNLLRDPDDDKFVDCAIAANARCIVATTVTLRCCGTWSFRRWRCWIRWGFGSCST